jgi:hypothetical protein
MQMQKGRSGKSEKEGPKESRTRFSRTQSANHTVRPSGRTLARPTHSYSIFTLPFLPTPCPFPSTPFLPFTSPRTSPRPLTHASSSPFPHLVTPRLVTPRLITPLLVSSLLSSSHRAARTRTVSPTLTLHPSCLTHSPGLTYPPCRVGESLSVISFANALPAMATESVTDATRAARSWTRAWTWTWAWGVG